MKKKKNENRGATFVGFRPQYFKHKDDKKIIRRQGEAICKGADC